MKFTASIQAAANAGNLELLKKLLSDMPEMPMHPWTRTFGPQNIEEIKNTSLEENAIFIAELLKNNAQKAKEMTQTTQPKWRRFTHKAAKLLIKKIIHNQSEENIAYFLGRLQAHLQLEVTNPYALTQWLIENNAQVLLKLPVFQALLHRDHISQLLRAAVEDNDVDALQKILQGEIIEQPDSFETPINERIKQYIPESVKNFIYSQGAEWISLFSGKDASRLNAQYQYNGFLNPREKIDLNVVWHANASLKETSPECAHLLMLYWLENEAFSLYPGSLDAKAIEAHLKTYGLLDNVKALRTLHVKQLLELSNTNNPDGFVKLFDKVKQEFDVATLKEIAIQLIFSGATDQAEIILNYKRRELAGENAALGQMWEVSAEKGYTNILQIPGIMPKVVDLKLLKKFIEMNALAGRADMVDLLINKTKAQNMVMIFSENLLEKIKQQQPTKGAEIAQKLADLKNRQPQPSFLTYFTTKMSALGSYLIPEIELTELDNDAEDYGFKEVKNSGERLLGGLGMGL